MPTPKKIFTMGGGEDPDFDLNEYDENMYCDFEIILEAFKYRGYDKGIRGIYMRLLHMDPPIIMNVKKFSVLCENTVFCAQSERQIRIDGCPKL